jgi:two-component system sensor histidine kinase GlrK
MNVLTRLTIGFCALFVAAMSVNIYALVKLNQFNKASTAMLETGDRMRQYEKRLGNALLSQALYEKKYAISGEETLFTRFLTAEKDFAGNLDGAIAIADTPESKEILATIKDGHNRYGTLAREEAGRLRTRRVYRADWYRAEKERILEDMIVELNRLKIAIEEDNDKRIQTLAETGTKALKVALAMALLSLIAGVIISFAVTRSITKPLAILKRKTREIASGNFKPSLNLSSPPEIGELARAFNVMCLRLNEMDTMKSDFFSLMAHELRTPLSSIKAGINLLAKNFDRWDVEKKERVLVIVSEECNRLIGLVNSLLDLSKMEAGMITFERVSAEMEPLIDKAIAEIEPLVAAKKIRLELDTAGTPPAVVIDSERILQVLRNLFGNAVKFTPEGGWIKVSARPVDGGVEVSVADSGPGIAGEDLEAIFDKYRQAPAGGRAGTGGTGLGLAIARHVVDAHGGRIWAESQLQKGSTFTFVLPA